MHSIASDPGPCVALRHGYRQSMAQHRAMGPWAFHMPVCIALPADSGLAAAGGGNEHPNDP